MSGFLPRQVIERRAVEHWKREGLSAGFDLDRLIDRLDLGLLWRPIEPVGGRQVAAELIARERLVTLNENLRVLLDGNPGFYRFTLAHELGHWDLHCGSVRDGSGELWADGPRLVCRRLVFGRDLQPAEVLSQAENQREHQANLFATYLLAPTEIFLAAFRSIGCDGWPATYQLAETLGLSVHATLISAGRRGARAPGRCGRPSFGTATPGGAGIIGALVRGGVPGALRFAATHAAGPRAQVAGLSRALSMAN